MNEPHFESSETAWREGGVLEGYRLDRRLGAGGMGEVWAATQLGTDAPRAIKTLLPHAGHDEHVRLAREGQSLAALKPHPNLIRVHSSGQAEGRGYLVLDFATGGDLGKRLERGPLPTAEVRALGLALCAGLAHVHAAGFFHRDLKPQNVLFHDGRALLCDFGLVGQTHRSSLTQSGDVLGTPAYMSPEQARGEPCDARTDVYGLGAVLYHALCGQPPFAASTIVQSLVQVTSQPPARPSSVLPGVDPDLERVCLRALAKAPDERYPDALALGHALSEAATPRSVAPLAATAAVALSLAAVAALTAVWIVRNSSSESTTAETAPVARAEPRPPPPRAAPQAPPARDPDVLLAELYAGLPPLEDLEHASSNRLTSMVQEGAGYRLEGARLLGSYSEPMAAPAREIATWFRAGIERGDLRAPGFMGKLLAKPGGAVLWPDTAERNQLICYLVRQSAHAGCLSATQWLSHEMIQRRYGLVPDAQEVYACLLRSEGVKNQPEDRNSFEKRARSNVIVLSTMRPERAIGPEQHDANLERLFSAELWSTAQTYERQTVLAHARELRRTRGRQVLDFLVAEPIDRDLLESSSQPQAVLLLDLDDLEAEGGSVAFSAGVSLCSAVRRHAVRASLTDRSLKQALQLLAHASRAGHPKSCFQLQVGLSHALATDADWLPPRAEDAVLEALYQGHTSGDVRCTVELAYDWLHPAEVHKPDPQEARDLLSSLGPVSDTTYRVRWKLATAHARLYLKHPVVGSPLEPQRILDLLDDATRAASRQDNRDRKSKLLSLRRQVLAQVQLGD